MQIHARLVAKSINLLSLLQKKKFYHDFIHESIEDKNVVVFNSGVVVFFGCTHAQQANYIQSLEPYMSQTIDDADAEEVEISIARSKTEGMDESTITLTSLNKDKREIIAHVLAKSLLLERYELLIDDVFSGLDPTFEHMKTKTLSKLGKHEIEKLISTNFSFQHNLIGKVRITEKPDTLWEHEEYEKLYQILMNSYEITDRYEILSEKMSVLDNMAQALLTFQDNREAHRLEWYIIILIVIEIIFTLIEFAGWKI